MVVYVKANENGGLHSMLYSPESPNRVIIGTTVKPDGDYYEVDLVDDKVVYTDTIDDVLPALNEVDTYIGGIVSLTQVAMADPANLMSQLWGNMGLLDAEVLLETQLSQKFVTVLSTILREAFSAVVIPGSEVNVYIYNLNAIRGIKKCQEES